MSCAVTASTAAGRSSLLICPNSIPPWTMAVFKYTSPLSSYKLRKLGTGMLVCLVRY